MENKNDKIVFWGCFIALITTSFAFFTRMYLCGGRIKGDFLLTDTQVGDLIGAGIWPFGISIILFSLIIDRVGYRLAMFFSFACYTVYLIMACMAYSTIQGVTGDALTAARADGFQLLYWGSVILALGNGTVEAFINPVVATMFSKQKTKWLNILHAGWPGGLVIAGLITVSMSDIAKEGDWRLVLAVIAIPAVTFLLMLLRAEFPVSEREQAGVSYREMLSEFGAFGALVGFGLIFMQLEGVLKDVVKDVFVWNSYVTMGLTALVTVAFGVYTRSVGRPFMAFLIIIMMPLATTEIGTDSWISNLMEGPMEAAGYNAGWVLIYTSAIMMVLRFFAGPIVHKLSPIGLLVISAVLAIAGLLALSQTGTSGLVIIFAAATLYGIGKTFFWPTMLGITAEQCPKGGALTLNAISGIGMIAVGVLGAPFIGSFSEKAAGLSLAENAQETAAIVLVDKKFLGSEYKEIDKDKKKELVEVKKDEKAKAAIEAAEKAGKLDALSKIAILPGFMLCCYIGMFLYFKSKGGYKAVEIGGGTHDVGGADEALADGSAGGGEA